MGYCTAQTEGDRRNCHRQIAFAQVSSGYAPISVRLVEAIAAPDGAALATELPQVPGLPHLAYAPRAFSREELGCAFDDAGAGVLAAGALHRVSPGSPASPGAKPVLVVVFVGGVTYAEIAALRLLSRRPDFPFTVLVAATAVINGAGLLQTLVMEMENSLQKTHATA